MFQPLGFGVPSQEGSTEAALERGFVHGLALTVGPGNFAGALQSLPGSAGRAGAIIPCTQGQRDFVVGSLMTCGIRGALS